MTTFYLIRHAEKDAPPDVLTGRTGGINLTPAGKAHAARLARHLSARGICRIYCSPIDRAQQTAAPLAEALGLRVEVKEAFTELAFGTWTQKREGELRDVERWKWFNTFRSGTRIPEGETMLEVQTRFVTELLHLREECGSSAVAIVSHGDPIRAAIAYFAGIPLDLAERLEIDVGSISVLALADWGARIVRLNELPA